MFSVERLVDLHIFRFDSGWNFVTFPPAKILKTPVVQMELDSLGKMEGTCACYGLTGLMIKGQRWNSA